ncbi:MAG: alpha-amylase family glycosyl hydrolase, partial [Exiguobacterium sp.]
MRRGVVLVLLSLLLFPTIVGAKEAATWEQERMYFIMVDRFVDGNPDNNEQVDKDDPKAFHGGDIRGVIEKLDYIESLGFTSIWLTPVFENMPDGYHGYWIKNFYNIDPQFGTKEDLQELVQEAHKRDMKVILDFVVNHVGPNHPWVEEKPEWFHEQLPIVFWKDQEQVETHWLFDLPDFKTEDP